MGGRFKRRECDDPGCDRVAGVRPVLDVPGVLGVCLCQVHRQCLIRALTKGGAWLVHPPPLDKLEE